MNRICNICYKEYITLEEPPKPRWLRHYCSKVCIKEAKKTIDWSDAIKINKNGYIYLEKNSLRIYEHRWVIEN